MSARFRRSSSPPTSARKSVAAAPYAISLAQEYQAKLTLLHVLPEPQAGDLRVTTEQLARAAEIRLRELVPAGCDLWCEPHCIVAYGVPANQILLAAEERKASLIVL